MAPVTLIVRKNMSHSLRKILTEGHRFDIKNCATQISDVVASDVPNSLSKHDRVIYDISSDEVVLCVGKKEKVISDSIEGEFFDTFYNVDIEIEVKKSNTNNIDGYYYHTNDKSDGGLIRITVDMDMTYDTRQLYPALVSVIAHEMQHVVQKCHLNVDLNRVYDDAQHHLQDYAEIDARIEEVMSTMDNSLSLSDFTSRMENYLTNYLKRNHLSFTYLQPSIEKHVNFYKDKILYYFQ